MGGCPDSCTKKQQYLDSLAALPCTDHSKDSVLFRRYLEGVAEFRDRWPSNWRSLVNDIIHKLSTQGCEALQAGGFVPKGGSWPLDFCAEENTYSLKSLRYLCPQKCKCEVQELDSDSV